MLYWTMQWTPHGQPLHRADAREELPAPAAFDPPTEQLAEQIPDLVIRFDQQLRHTYCNSAVERLTGVSRAALLSRTLEQCGVAAEQATRWRDRLRRVLDRGIPEEMLIGYHAPDGLRHYEARLVPQRGASGDVESVLAICRDVTAERLVLRQLQESEERFRALVLANASAVWLTDAKGKVLLASSSWRSLTGQTEDNARGEGWLAAVHADDRHNVETCWRAAIAQGTPLEVEFRVRSADGSYRWLRDRGVAVRRGDGSIREWVGECLDVDERRRAEAALRESEAMFRAVQDASPDGFSLLRCIRDATGKINDFEWIHLNPAGERFHAPLGGDLRGRRLREPGLPAEIRQLFGNYVHVVSSGEPLVRELRYRHPVWGDLWLHVTTVKVGDGVGVTYRDVTAQRRAERERGRLLEEAERARREAEAANRSKSEFLAVMSHELRTPLNAIGGHIELVELGIHGPVTTAQRDAFVRVQRSQRHLLGLINQVLNYARIEAGAVTYDLQPVLVGDVIAAVEAVVAPQLRDKELMHAIDVESTSLCVHADPERLQQILLNLLSNAIKFTESGGEVRISASPLDESARQVRIAVTDTGRGIPAEKLEAIFEPFVQVDSRLTRTEGGTGLGLAISRDLARRMAGDLTVVSELGQGSTFTITLNADRIATRQLVS